MTDATLLVKALRAEEERRDQFAADVRRAVEFIYAVGGTTEVIVFRSEVHKAVATALELPANMSPQLRSYINQIVVGMGARLIQLGGQKFFSSMRRRDMDLAMARRTSTDLRRRYCRPAKTKTRGATGIHGAERDLKAVAAEWEARLTSEGMPAELPAIPRPRVAPRDGQRFEQDAGRFEAPTLVTTGGGVHRQPSTRRADFVQAEQDEVGSLLSEIEEERQVLKLRAEGLSLRDIGLRMGEDKMYIDRVLKRIKARRK